LSISRADPAREMGDNKQLVNYLWLVVVRESLYERG